MTNLLKKLINNLNSLVDAELTCLIKFDQNKFTLVEYKSNGNLKYDFPALINQVVELDFQSVQKKIIESNNYISFCVNDFLNGNFQYYVLSTSQNEEHYSELMQKLHLEATEAIKEYIILTEKYENKVLAKNDYFHLFAEASNELILILDQSGIINSVNKYGLEKLKYASDEILEKHFFSLISEADKSKVAQAFQKIIVEKTIINLNVEIIPKVSVELLFNMNLIPVFNNEKLEKLLIVGSNLNEQNIEKKKSEELLAKLTEANRINSIEKDRAKQQISLLSELNNLKNEFISNVSHELRTPLASIIGFSETILDDKNLTVDRAKEFNEVILTESKRLAKLINDVLDFSELENEKQHLKKNSTNIIEILTSCIENYENESTDKKITLTSKLPESEIIIYADQERLIKAFNYLLSNAVKFTNENGRITIIAQEFLKEVEIVISDTGVGISEQKIPLLFNKFSKVKRAGNNLPGAGFGLVTVKQIIDLHKGLIRIKSEVNKGTSFIIRLPKYSFN